jgi:hypothetical protein
MNERAMFPLASIDSDFMDRIREAARFFTELQVHIVIFHI